MNEKKDIKDKSDIVWIVDAFYQKIRADALLSPVFRLRIADNDWARHLHIMYSFWNTVLFAEADYRGNPFPRHLGLGIEPVHFDRWLVLFHQTVDERYSGAKAEEIKDRAVKMRHLFQSKLADAGHPGRTPLV